MVDELAHLRAELRAEEGRRKHRPSKHTLERQCTATTRAGRQCKAPRAKRRDGTLATVCRMHGGTPPPTLEAQARSLERLVAWRQAQADGARTKLAGVREAIERARVMGVSPDVHTCEQSITPPASELNSPQDSADSPHAKDGR